MTSLDDYTGVGSAGDSTNAYVVLTTLGEAPAACGIFRTREEAEIWIDGSDRSDDLHIQATPLVKPEGEA